MAKHMRFSTGSTPVPSKPEYGHFAIDTNAVGASRRGMRIAPMQQTSGAGS